MKKIAIASCMLALGTTSAWAAEPEHELYGQLNYSLNDAQAENPINGLPVQDGISAENNQSRIGVKGRSGGIIYRFETGLDVDGNTGTGTSREMYIGLVSNGGTVLVGRASSPYKLAIKSVDPFYDTTSVDFLGRFNPASAGTYGQSALVNGFSNNGITYITPDLGGFTISAATYIGDAVDEADDDEYDFSLGLDFTHGAISAGLHGILSGDEDTGAVSVSGGGAVEWVISAYAAAQFTRFQLGASIEQVELSNSDEDRTYFYANGVFSATNNLRFALSMGHVTQGPGEGVGFTLGSFTEVYPNMTWYLQYSVVDLESEIADTRITTTGLKYAFSI